jgi:hypothetical protein
LRLNSTGFPPVFLKPRIMKGMIAHPSKAPDVARLCLVLPELVPSLRPFGVAWSLSIRYLRIQLITSKNVATPCCQPGGFTDALATRGARICPRCPRTFVSPMHKKPPRGTLYYECKRCGRKTKTYRKITRHLHRCAKEDLRLGRRKRTSAP